MKLTKSEAMARLIAHDHGVLATVHSERGVDAIPIVYAVTGDFVGVPIDRVKPKSSQRLQREVNLESDPRATLLVEHWDRDDWSKLWWVRAHLHYEGAEPSEQSARLNAQLAAAFTQYHDQPFTDTLVLRIDAVSGWAATA